MVSSGFYKGHAIRIAVGITMLVLAASAGADTTYVPEDYAKIQWAIDL